MADALCLAAHGGAYARSGKNAHGPLCFLIVRQGRWASWQWHSVFLPSAPNRAETSLAVASRPHLHKAVQQRAVLGTVLPSDLSKLASCYTPRPYAGASVPGFEHSAQLRDTPARRPASGRVPFKTSRSRISAWSEPRAMRVRVDSGMRRARWPHCREHPPIPRRDLEPPF